MHILMYDEIEARHWEERDVVLLERLFLICFLKEEKIVIL